MAVDLHAAQIQGFFNIPFDHLFAIPTLAKYWKNQNGASQPSVVVSPRCRRCGSGTCICQTN